MVVQVIAAAGRAASVAAKTGSKAAKLSAQGAKAGTKAVQSGASAANTGGRYAVSTERTPTGGVINRTTAKEGTLSKEFEEYARRQREIRKKWDKEKQKFFHQDEENQSGGASMMAYAAPLVIAGLKDLLDFAVIGSFPGIGMIVTGCFGALIVLLLAVTPGATSRNRASFMVAAGLTMMGGSIVEGVAFGLNFMPLMTIAVVSIYIREKNGSAHGGVLLGKINDIRKRTLPV